MSTLQWAENEIKNAKQGCDEYISLCYDSALKAYASLCDDGHSGMSWSITKNILIKLMNNIPLTPIEDVPENWHKCDLGDNEYQCVKCSSLFKTIKDDVVSFSDISRCYAKDIKTGCTFTGSVCNIIDELFPITLPYTPRVDKYVIELEDFDYNNDEYRAIYRIIVPGEDNIKIEKYYKNNELISKEEWLEVYSQKELNNMKELMKKQTQDE